MTKQSKDLLSNKIQLISVMEANMRAKLSYIQQRQADMEVSHIDETLVTDCGMPSDTFNTAFGGNITEGSAKEVFDFYKQKNHPAAWWLGPSSNNETSQAHLSAAGFQHDEHDVGMACDLTDVEVKYDHPEGLEIKVCLDAQTFSDFGAVLASIFSPPDIHVETYYQKMAHLGAEQLTDLDLFVGYVNGKAVATAAMFKTDVAGIFDISTRPEERKKGYGSAMFCHVLKDAQRQGFDVSVLQASPDGLGIYKRFGFKKICDFEVWSNISE